jgi:glutamate-1-semialdehyde aminotransferase
LPLSGVIGRAEMLDAAAPGELGGTYAGSPLGCAAALAAASSISARPMTPLSGNPAASDLDTVIKSGTAPSSFHQNVSSSTSPLFVKNTALFL